MATETHLLRAARISRGWSQTQASEALAELAARRGVAVAAPSSLKTQLSRWENQHVMPEHSYRVLLRELYERSDEEMGLVVNAAHPADSEDEMAALLTGLAVASAVDEPAVKLLRDQLAATRALDRRLGGAAAGESIRGQLSHLERALTYSVSRHMRGELARLMGAAATLAGRVALDESRPAAAWRHFETAKRAGFEVGSSVTISCAMVEQARVLTEIGQQLRAIEVIEQATEVSTSAESPATRAWLAANRGDALAAAGSESEARSAYQAAEEQLSASSYEVDFGYPLHMSVEFDLGALHRHRGHGLHLLRDDEQAILDLEHALRSETSSVRDVAAVHVDLAHAFDATERPSAAKSHARTARELANRIGSTLLAAKLDRGPVPPRHEPVSRS